MKIKRNLIKKKKVYLIGSSNYVTCSLVVCSSEIERFLSDGARVGVRLIGATDNEVSRGSVDIALESKHKRYVHMLWWSFGAPHTCEEPIEEKETKYG